MAHNQSKLILSQSVLCRQVWL